MKTVIDLNTISKFDLTACGRAQNASRKTDGFTSCC